MQYRMEHDSMGEVKVPASALWGAQTQRSCNNFRIGSERMPADIIQAFAFLKKAAAITNCELGRLDKQRSRLIGSVCDEILEGSLDDAFPLVVWQTGSGTQSNMNVNEVIANRANQLRASDAEALHPNDTVNMSQSSNDTFPTALHIASVLALTGRLLPSLQTLIKTLIRLEQENKDVIKCGRTHLQDAVPITFGQEISGWRTMLEASEEQITSTLPHLSRLALGGTAVGTGLNTPAGFDKLVAQHVSELCGHDFETDPNKFHALTSKDAVSFAHGALKTLAANLMKIANDVRWLASGPRNGLGEITIPENEPGSSIMPGKVNPTQCEAVTMVAVQVMGNDATIGFAASQGNFELNVFMPVIAYDFLQSANLLADVMRSFEKNCVAGIHANLAKMRSNLNDSLMLVTCLNPHIGYERAAQVAHKAYAEETSLRDACVSLGFLSADEFDAVFKPEDMV